MCVVIIKYVNLCGIVILFVLVVDVYCKVYECDLLSVYGGVIVVNIEVSVEMVEYVSIIFIEVIVVFGYVFGVFDVLVCKKNIWVLVVVELLVGGSELCLISGGLLIQQSDQFDVYGDNLVNWILVIGLFVDFVMLIDLVFVW